MNDDSGVSTMLNTVIVAVSALAMIFGGVVPYIPQYLDIKKNESCEGFSLYVCLVLLVANTLRILFWFGHWFELPLLFQSIIMITTMLLMINLCVNVKNRGQIIQSKEHVFTDFDYAYFWEWTDIQSYVEFMMTFATMGCFCMYIFIDSLVFIETLGFISVFTEALLGVPQFYKNYTSKSTYGMSRKMVGMWLCGDTFKTVYFLLRQAPVQFFICGCIQVMIDVSILGQCLLYKNKTIQLMH